ncbi:foldase protein PrsA [Lachnospiraceae bacterium C7]|nr:foldase protein PrsA [Lachnospiraceae bacterium C7]
MKAKRIAALFVATTLCISTLFGCAINKNEVAATYKGGEVKLGEANFFARYQQAAVEPMYKQYYGDKVWSQSFSADGGTLEDQTITQSIDSLHKLHTLKDHAKDKNVSLTKNEKNAIKKAAKKFIKDNKKDTLDEMTADESTVEDVLELYTYQAKMRKEIIKDADTNVSAEEANMRAYSMIRVDLSGKMDQQTGQQTAYTADELKEVKANAKKMAEEIKSGADMTKTAEKYGNTVTPGTYGKDDSTLESKVKKELDKLKEGEVSSLIKTDTALYVVRIDKNTDKDATEQNKKSIISQRQEKLFSDTIKKWQKGDKWKVNKKAIEKISFKNSLNKTVKENTEKASTNQQTTSTQNATESTSTQK